MVYGHFNKHAIYIKMDTIYTFQKIMLPTVCVC